MEPPRYTERPSPQDSNHTPVPVFPRPPGKPSESAGCSRAFRGYILVFSEQVFRDGTRPGERLAVKLRDPCAVGDETGPGLGGAIRHSAPKCLHRLVSQGCGAYPSAAHGTHALIPPGSGTPCSPSLLELSRVCPQTSRAGSAGLALAGCQGRQDAVMGFPSP